MVVGESGQSAARVVETVVDKQRNGGKVGIGHLSRGSVFESDLRAVAMDVLRHRIGLTYEAEAENITTEQIVTEILNRVEVP